MSSKTKATPPEPGFTTALAELEAILQRIEREEVDVDRLAAELEL